MSMAPVERPLSFEEFLELEAAADRKHEYVAGYVCALAGAQRRHNRIAGRIFARLEQAAEACGCEAFGCPLRTRAAVPRPSGAAVSIPRIFDFKHGAFHA